MKNSNKTKRNSTLTEIIISLLFLTILKTTSYSVIIDNENNLIIPEGETCLLKGTTIFNNVKIYGTLSVIPYASSNPESGGIDLQAYQIEISSTGKIEATGKGYISGEGPGSGLEKLDMPGSGAGYGGEGGININGWLSGGKEYGNIYNPDDLGSGGGKTIENGINIAGKGGGKIKLKAGRIINNGVIESNGMPSPI